MNIGIKASEAGKAYLESLDLETVEHFYAEVEDANNADLTAENERELPCVVCFCTVGEEYPMGTGNYNVDLHFQVEVSADDHTAAEISEIFDEVWENVSTDTILADLSAAGEGFTAFGFNDGIRQSPQEIDGRVRIKSMILSFNCCALDVS
jgi:hypothetical protein